MTKESIIDDPIPLIKTLEEIYSKERVLKETQRWDLISKKFQEEFNKLPQFIARAPGRVNLMGDHVDHMKFSCLPAALEMDILMAVYVKNENELENNDQHASKESSKSKITFKLKNTTKRFKETEFESEFLNTDLVELHHHGDCRWSNYFKAAFKGLFPHLPKSVLISNSRPIKVEVLVDGTIPPESSLSSSAAMTTCSSIVILEAFKARNFINRKEMAKVAIESERLVGVNSGGMDQAASIFGETGKALHISFEPELNAETIQLPPSDPPYLFVIANTLVISDKKVMGPVQYNLRVCELLIACRCLSKSLDLPQDDSTRLLKPLMDKYFEKNPIKYDQVDKNIQYYWNNWGIEAAQIAKLKEISLKILPENAISRQEAENLSGFKDSTFEKEFTSKFPVKTEKFHLQKRVRHVLNESLHVLQFKSVCQDNKNDDNNQENKNSSEIKYKNLGSIIQNSRKSLFNDFENSCFELEKVCKILENNGSLGSRPTGAGWGGSTISLVENKNVEKVLEALRIEYYNEKFKNLSSNEAKEQFNNSVLVSQPAKGACIYLL